MSTEEEMDFIKRYITDQMAPAEKHEFEGRLATDQSLAREVELGRLAINAIDLMIADSLRQELKDMSARDRVVDLKSRRRRYFVLSLAASLLLLVGVFFFMRPAGSGLSASQMAMGYYQLPSNGLRGDDGQIPQQLSDGILALQRGEALLANEFFAQLSDEDPYKPMATYYMGHAMMMQGDYASAMFAFGQAMQSADPRWLAEAQWHIWLACVAHDATNCNAYLSPLIADTTHPYHQSANELMKKLERRK